MLVSLFFLSVGLYVAFFPDGLLLAVWNDAATRHFLGGVLSGEAEAFRSFLFGPLGGTIAGFYILQLFILWNAFDRKEGWAWWAIAAGTVVWFTVDSGRSVQHGAWFNVFLVNLPALVTVGLPLAMTYSYFAGSRGEPAHDGRLAGRCGRDRARLFRRFGRTRR